MRVSNSSLIPPKRQRGEPYVDDISTAEPIRFGQTFVVRRPGQRSSGRGQRYKKRGDFRVLELSEGDKHQKTNTHRLRGYSVCAVAHGDHGLLAVCAGLNGIVVGPVYLGAYPKKVRNAWIPSKQEWLSLGKFKVGISRHFACRLLGCLSTSAPAEVWAAPACLALMSSL